MKHVGLLKAILMLTVFLFVILLGLAWTVVLLADKMP
jgi:hypothetical protein